MKTRYSLTLALLILLPAAHPAQAGWGREVGGLLSNLPVVRGVGEKILDNRIAFIRTSQKQAHTMGRIRPDLGSQANLRAAPGTGASSPVIGQLSPGDGFIILARVTGKPWFHIRLNNGRKAYIHSNLVIVNN